MQIRKYVISLCLPLVLWACNSRQGQPLDVDALVEYIPVQFNADGRWGMISTDGNVMFEDEFIDQPSVAVNGLFSAPEGNGYSLYSVGDQPHLIGDCENMRHVGFCNDGLVPVSPAEGRIRVVDAAGSLRFTLEPVSDKEIVGCSNMYSNGLLVVTDESGLSGCVDTNGKMAILPTYAHIEDFSEGYAVAVRPDSSYVVIDCDGTVVTEVRHGYRIVSSMVSDGHFVIADSVGHFDFMDVKGAVSKIPTKVREVGKYNKDIFAYKADNDFWGVMSRSDDYEMLIRPKFKCVTILPENNELLVNLDGNWMIINLQGKKIVDFGDRYLNMVYTGFKGAIKYLAQENAGWVLLDKDGNEIAINRSIANIAYSATDAATLTANYEVKPKVEFVKEVVAQIAPNSLCGVQLNGLANPLYRKQSPDSLRGTKEFVPDSVPALAGFNDVALIAVTDRLIAVGARFNVNTERVEYAFQPANTVAAIELDIVTDDAEMFSRTKPEMSSALEELGFKMVEEGDDAVIYRSQYANLEISYDPDDHTITVLMYRL